MEPSQSSSLEEQPVEAVPGTEDGQPSSQGSQTSAPKVVNGLSDNYPELNDDRVGLLDFLLGIHQDKVKWLQIHLTLVYAFVLILVGILIHLTILFWRIEQKSRTEPVYELDSQDVASPRSPTTTSDTMQPLGLSPCSCLVEGFPIEGHQESSYRTYRPSRRVSMTIENVSLRQLMDTVHLLYGVNFVNGENVEPVIKATQHMSFSVENVTLESLVHTMFLNQPALQYQYDSLGVVVLLKGG